MRRSLSSGFAVKLASVNNPRMLILESSYSLKQVAAQFVPFIPLSLAMRFPLPAYKWIKYMECLIFIIHGTKDKLIPLESSVKLLRINPPQNHYPLPNPA